MVRQLKIDLFYLVGFMVYFGYGIRHSKENKLMDYSAMMVVGGDDTDALSLDGSIHRPQTDGMKVSTISSPNSTATDSPVVIQQSN